MAVNKRVFPDGPKGYPLIGALPQMLGTPLRFFSGLAKEHGDLVHFRLGRGNAFFLNHPDLIQHVLQTQDKNYRKSESTPIVERVLGQGLVVSTGAYWQLQRKLMQPAFHSTTVMGWADIIQKEAQDMAMIWSNLASANLSFDIWREMLRVTLRIAVRTVFGSEMELDIPSLQHAWTAVLDHFIVKSFSIVSMPDWWPSAQNRRFDLALQTLEETVQSIIEQKRQRPLGNDVLSLLLSAQDEETGMGMSDKQIRDEVMSLLLASHETTSNVLAWAIYLVAKHPDVLAKMRQEMQQLRVEAVPSSAQKLVQLKYTRLVLSETMRLYPPFWLMYRTPIEQDVIDGHIVEAGDMVMMCPYVLHRDGRFWTDPDLFQPERFRQRVVSNSYFPFGLGPHTCIGREFALVEMQIILATIFNRYDVTILQEPELEPSVTLRPKDGIQVILTERL